MFNEQNIAIIRSCFLSGKCNLNTNIQNIIILVIIANNVAVKKYRKPYGTVTQHPGGHGRGGRADVSRQTTTAQYSRRINKDCQNCKCFNLHLIS